MTESESSTVRWSVEQRLAFVDRRLFWEGQINRADLVKHFSISVPQASADLATYDRLAQGNMSYDAKVKSYVATPAFNPRSQPSARQYLAQLQLVADEVLAKEASWLGHFPPYGIVPRIRRKLEAAILRRMLHAIRHGHALEVDYQSMQSDEASRRWIAPHALGFDGQRWHVRAWCYRKERFLDFVMARVLKVHGTRPESKDASTDHAWNGLVQLRLGPNPKLAPALQKAIALDFGMTAGEVQIEVRLSLVYYLARQMLLDVADHLVPERVQVVLLNAGEVNRRLAEVGESPLPTG